MCQRLVTLLVRTIRRQWLGHSVGENRGRCSPSWFQHQTELSDASPSLHSSVPRASARDRCRTEAKRTGLTDTAPESRVLRVGRAVRQSAHPRARVASTHHAPSRCGDRDRLRKPCLHLRDLAHDACLQVRRHPEVVERLTDLVLGKRANMPVEQPKRIDDHPRRHTVGADRNPRDLAAQRLAGFRSLHDRRPASVGDDKRGHLLHLAVFEPRNVEGDALVPLGVCRRQRAMHDEEHALKYIVRHRLHRPHSATLSLQVQASNG